MDEGSREEGSPPLESEPSASESSTSTSRLISWRPRPLAFRPYLSTSDTNAKLQPLRVVVRRPLVARLTKDIVEIYQICNPNFSYSEELNPKRFLTSPSIGLLNDGFDNSNSDLILTVNHSLINSETKRRYIVKDVLGHGTFGQVAKCWVADTKSFVAVKIIKNSPAYYHQALVEVSILTTLNKKYDPEDKHHIVRIYDYFVYQRHLCIAFELLDTNLYELIKLNHFRGLSLSIVQLFSKQILRGLALMKDASIIHCDLKPENILLCTSVKPAEIKIIDFGSACKENNTVYSYIQSRYYRSPEVLLGYQYSTSIDMWSFGCIVAELFLGLPLFPGASEFDLLRRMIKILGGQPPDYILQKAKNTSKFFKFIGSINIEERDQNHRNNCSMFQVLTEEEYAARESTKPSIGKEYFNHMNLEAIVTKYPYRKNLPEEEIVKESQIRLALIDFLRGLVEFDPEKRWSPLQASKHPFVTGEPFTCPYKPAPETPHMPVSQNVKVNHHPAGGHWFAAGLSPNISGRNKASMPNSPHYQFMPYVHPGSYGSLGSHGSYTDGLGLGSSYGSYGDNSNFHAFYSPAGPSGMNVYAQSGMSILGNSPDTRHIMQLPHGSGIGFSPGNFAPMSLGSSPSQFTPPSSYNQISAGSPGHYGPPSPVRGNCHGSPLGKMASGSQYNRRKNWAYHGNFQSQETGSSNCQGNVADINTFGQPEGNSSVFVVSPSHRQPNLSASTWRSQQGGRSVTSGYSSHMHTVHGSGYERSEASNSLPDPGDWDPNYSEELLLQEDSSDVNSMTSEFIKGMHLSQPSISTEPLIGAGSSNRISGASVSMQRHEGPIQSFSLGESGSNPAVHGYVHMTNQSYFSPHSAQSSPSRLGQRHNMGLMILLVLALIAVSYHAVVVLTLGPHLFDGGFKSFCYFLLLALFHVLLVLLTWSYMMVVVRDPGAVPANWRVSAEQDLDKDECISSNPSVPDGNLVMPSSSEGLGGTPALRYCDRCQNGKPPRCHHCSVCQRCVLKMDHHCIWVVNCVGARNYKFFLLFVLYTFLETLMDTLVLLPGFINFFHQAEHHSGSPGKLAITFLAFVLNLAFVLSLLCFLVMHTSLLLSNTTSIEVHEKKKYERWKYDLGWRKNIEQVFGTRKVFWLFPLFSKEDLERVPALHGLDFPTCSDTNV